jgi:hypothetical protein
VSNQRSKRARRWAGRWKDGTENKLEGGIPRLLVMVIKVDPFTKLLDYDTIDLRMCMTEQHPNEFLVV